jgi:hypothetical protein
MFISYLGAEAVGDGEGEAEPRREDPAGRRRGARVPAGLLGRERRAAGQGPPVLPLHHRRPHRRDALRVHPQYRLPQRSLPRRHLSGRRSGRPGALQGGRSPEDDQAGETERGRRETGEEVHPVGHRGRFRVLVHGVRELPEMPQIHAAGDLRALAHGAARPAQGVVEAGPIVFGGPCERASYLCYSTSEVCGLPCEATSCWNVRS